MGLVYKLKQLWEYLSSEEDNESSLRNEDTLSREDEIALDLMPLNKHICPKCKTVLDKQEGFDPARGYWKCKKCGTFSFGANIYQGERFPGVIWFCDNCEDCLSKQEGFSDYYDTWECQKCGYINSITQDNIQKRK